MEVTPADFDNGEILKVFKTKFAHVTYCVFEINGEVRVVENVPGEHAEVKVIKILEENMEDILHRNDRITLYMNYSPCTVDGSGTKHNCAEKIRKLKRRNPSLQLTICYAYPYYDNRPENEKGWGKLTASGVTLNQINDQSPEWNDLIDLLSRWYAAPNEQNGNAEEQEDDGTEAELNQAMAAMKPYSN